MELLGDLPGGQIRSIAESVSNNGVIVGSGRPPESTQVAARWTDSTGWQALSANDGIFSWAHDVSADGSVIVGRIGGGRGSQAFRWTEAGGIVFLGDLPNGNQERQASGVSADGNIVVGSAFTSAGFEPFRWTAATGMVGLGSLPGVIPVTVSHTVSISANGLVIVCYSVVNSDPVAVERGFRWTQETGLVEIPKAPGIPNIGFAPTAVSGDGSIILGRKLIWDAVNGTRLLENVFIHEYGLAQDFAGWTGLTATGISANGRVIVGNGSNPDGNNEAWVVKLDQATSPPRPPGNFNGDGFVDAADYVAWRQGLGSTHAQADYEVWKSNFGKQRLRAVLGTTVSDVDISATNELQSFVAGGTRYTQADLIQPTLVEFAANSESTLGNIVVPAGTSVPAPGTRAALLTDDFRVDTGIVSPAVGPTAATLNFSPPLVNGPGPDLVVFEIGEKSPLPGVPLQLTVNDTTGVVSVVAWGLTEFAPNVDYYSRVAGIPTSLNQLENDSHANTSNIHDYPLIGLAIDLDELGVSRLAEISTIQFGTRAGSPAYFPYFEPMLFMGIRSVAALAGDFNGDGAVDATDYLVWREGLGTTYTQADYDVWRAHFGQTAGSSTSHVSVPEPNSVALSLFALAPLLLLYRAHLPGLPGWKQVWKPESTIDQTTRLRPARLGGTMFDCLFAGETPLHADKLRGDEASFRFGIWYRNIGPRSKLLWCQPHLRKDQNHDTPQCVHVG
jgi:uncharacterized membrane protein